jgi:hypothetical protein
MWFAIPSCPVMGWDVAPVLEDAPPVVVLLTNYGGVRHAHLEPVELTEDGRILHTPAAAPGWNFAGDTDRTANFRELSQRCCTIRLPTCCASTTTNKRYQQPDAGPRRQCRTHPSRLRPRPHIPVITAPSSATRPSRTVLRHSHREDLRLASSARCSHTPPRHTRIVVDQIPPKSPAT